MQVEFEVCYELSDIVYLRVRSEKVKGMVTGYTFRPGSSAVYHVTWALGEESAHYAVELSDTYINDFDSDL